MSAPAKPKYRTTNWKEYNAPLKTRGSLLIWLEKDMHWAVPAPGKWQIKARKYNGRAIETSQHTLSHWLARQIAEPGKFDSGPKPEAAVGNRRGIVSFFSIYCDGRPQGHIAIVSRDRWGSNLRCGNEIDGMATGCYWSSREVWLWLLQ